MFISTLWHMPLIGTKTSLFANALTRYVLKLDRHGFKIRNGPTLSEDVNRSRGRVPVIEYLGQKWYNKEGNHLIRMRCPIALWVQVQRWAGE